MSVVTNGEKLYTKCSNCGKPTLEIFVTRPGVKDEKGKPFIWQVKTNCPYGCKDLTYPVEVNGLYHYGGYSVHDPSDIDETKFITNPVDVAVDDDNNVLIKVVKV